MVLESGSFLMVQYVLTFLLDFEGFRLLEVLTTKFVTVANDARTNLAIDYASDQIR